MSRKRPIAKLLVFLSVALSIVALSVGSTLYFNHIDIGPFGGKIKKALGLNYSHATLTDAELMCKNRAKSRFSGRIRILHVDRRSTRLDVKDDLFKVFMEAQVFANSDREGPVRKIFINCFTYTEHAGIERFQFAGDTKSNRDPDNGETGYFGI